MCIYHQFCGSKVVSHLTKRANSINYKKLNRSAIQTKVVHKQRQVLQSRAIPPSRVMKCSKLHNKNNHRNWREQVQCQHVLFVILKYEHKWMITNRQVMHWCWCSVEWGIHHLLWVCHMRSFWTQLAVGLGLWKVSECEVLSGGQYF